MSSEKVNTLKQIRDRLDTIIGDVYSLKDDLYDVMNPDTKAILLQNYSEQNLPTTPEEMGAMFFNTDRHTPAWYNGGSYEYASYIESEDVLTSEQTVSGTTTETTVHTITIPAGTFVEGRVYKLYTSGKFSTANTSSDFTLHVGFSGNDVCDISSAGGNVTDAAWWAETNFTVYDTGNDLELMPHCLGIFDGQAADNHAHITQVDETTATDIEVSIEWNDGSAGNSATLSQCFLQLLA